MICEEVRPVGKIVLLREKHICSNLWNSQKGAKMCFYTVSMLPLVESGAFFVAT